MTKKEGRMLVNLDDIEIELIKIYKLIDDSNNKDEIKLRVKTALSKITRINEIYND